ncbi:MAG: transcription-repair coupling factor [Porticoccaceae bacterium]
MAVRLQETAINTATQQLLPKAMPRAGEKRRWTGLAGSASALAVFTAAQQHQGLSVVVTATAREASALRDAIDFYSASEPLTVVELPDWETLPYDIFSPHQDIISQRIATLAALPSLVQGILIAPLSTLMHRLPPTDYVASQSFSYQVGGTVDRQALITQLTRAGYQRVETVFEHGEFALRGAIVDIFPMGNELPLRLDLLDDELDTLRTFDPESQRTIDSIAAIELLPAREFPLDRDGINRFLNNWHIQFDGRGAKSTLYQDVEAGIAPQGIEYYLPLFFEQTATLFDYLPENTLMFNSGALEDKAGEFWQDVTERYSEYGVDPERPILPPATLFLSIDQLFAGFKQCPTIILEKKTISTAHSDSINSIELPDVAIDAKRDNPLIALQAFLAGQPDLRVLLCSESAGRREALLELLQKSALQAQAVEGWQEFLSSDFSLAITVGGLDESVILPNLGVAVITEAALFGQQVLQRRRRSKASSQSENHFKSLAELQVGAPVVHLDHGIGRYHGLVTLEVDKSTQEFLQLRYADDANIYVPVGSLNLISRYGGSDPELAPLHKLGNDRWSKARAKAAEQVRDSAAELLEIYAKRAARKGFRCSDDERDYLAFCADFPFETTADQQEAIDAVRRDQLAEQPMDRLICGDVGFGKTEVAMRAAFTAVNSGQQVIVLVPTTLLAHQHLENFRDRFANWPVRVEELSRFRSGKEQQDVLAALNNGRVDILISTHKLLHSKIDTERLGLLIIDEEHRFGVHQKEQIKALRAEVDILAMTATPIPRTLNMAMHSIRDLSIIATPPARRLSVKTFIRQNESRIVREAVLREVLRGGQVYYLHNDIKSINRCAEELAALLPEARIEVAHGQMRERELEKIMSDFYHQRFNVLVCTTIIETGIDIPSANTIVMERADKLGLAQLHQLRGRVGRSHHQAYAYLLTPDKRALTRDAEKRLEAIAAADHLGSGFTLATNDMEIRGAGELLGEEQSGHIQAVGFTLYMDMLARAVKALQSGKIPASGLEGPTITEIDLHCPALIPDDYLPDVNARLMLYKRIANVEQSSELRELQVEMIDRFGLLPEAAKMLLAVTELKLRAIALGVDKIEMNSSGGRIVFNNTTPIEPLAIIQLMQSNPERYRLRGGDQLILHSEQPSAADRLNGAEEIIDILQKLADQPTH